MKRISLEFLLIFPSAFSKRKKNHPLLLAVFLLSHTLTNSRFQFRPTHIYSLFFWHNTTDLDWLNLQHQLKYFFFILQQQQAFSSSSTPTPPSALHPRDCQASCVFTKRETAWSQPVYGVGCLVLASAPRMRNYGHQFHQT